VSVHGFFKRARYKTKTNPPDKDGEKKIIRQRQGNLVLARDEVMSRTKTNIDRRTYRVCLALSCLGLAYLVLSYMVGLALSCLILLSCLVLKHIGLSTHRTGANQKKKGDEKRRRQAQI
jgi:hypothetical protein